MQALFLKVLEISLTGSLFAIAVMLARLLCRKAPRWIFCVLWGLVALRLILPVSIESNLSIVPEPIASGQVISAIGESYVGSVDIYYESNAGYANALDAGRQPVYSNDGYYVVTNQGSLDAPATVGDTVFPILAWIWVAGMAAMTGYLLLSFHLLKRGMAEATFLRDNIWQCEQVDSPFVLGIIRPRIYLPYSITDADMANVIAHEQAHIHRRDHWWKPLGFLLLSVHWFNPLMWIAYILLCRDIEAACDEKVIRNMEKDEMRAYSTALLHCSVRRSRVAACPLAFGEQGVKERIRRVMGYKKPGFWIIIAAAASCIVASVCFLTDPVLGNFGVLPHIHSHGYVVEEVTYEDGMYSFSVTAGENSPIYSISAGMRLSSQKEHSEEGIWTRLGKLEETKLTKESFDDLFGPGRWERGQSAKNVRNNTERAWRLIYNQETLYYVLQQKNGDLYLAFGYADTAKPSIRWLYKLAIDANSSSGIVAKSGENSVPLISFPKGTAAAAYVDSIYWLHIDPGPDASVPFSVWQDGERMQGYYNAFDSETFEPIEHWVPSGLEPQTYLFQNADPARSYIVVAAFSTDADAPVYAFGARFDAPPYNNFDSGPVKTIEGNLMTYHQNTDGTWQVGGRHYQYRLEISGRMPNAAVDSTFVYLSNLKTITFNQAWKASGLSSNLDDYFTAEEAILVEWLTGDRRLVWGWAQGLEQEEIISAAPWRQDDAYRELEPLDDAEILELTKLLNKLTKDNFTENKDMTGGTPTYGIAIRTASETYHINESIAPNGALEIGYRGKMWWIDDAALLEFVQRVTGTRRAE